jgi:hypothetical protein
MIIRKLNSSDDLYNSSDNDTLNNNSDNNDIYLQFLEEKRVDVAISLTLRPLPYAVNMFHSASTVFQ